MIYKGIKFIFNYKMSKLICPSCKQTGEYFCHNNFDTYMCDCGCNFFRKNKECIIGKNPFGGGVISQHHDPICPNCHKESNCDIVCDNDCGTSECECGCEFYIVGDKIIRGHNPKCGM